MSRARTACTDCALPFYNDVNESCPYCGTPGPTDARAAPGRERVTCSDCGLPHYGTDCPYCAAATANAAATASTDSEPTADTGTDAEAVDDPTAPEPEPTTDTEPDPASETPPPVQRRDERRQSADGSRTVVGRVLGAVRSLFGR